nr:MAG TPA: hypothetical protein [Bacteriophage sp.]
MTSKRLKVCRVARGFNIQCFLYTKHCQKQEHIADNRHKVLKK